MDGTGFDQLTRAVAKSGSRRRLLAALLAGALGSLRLRTSVADDSGTAIADASGGNHNQAIGTDPTPSGNDGNTHDHDHDHDANDHERDDKDDNHDRDTKDGNDGDHSGPAVEFCPVEVTIEKGTECTCPDDTSHCETASGSGNFICCLQPGCQESEGTLTCSS